MKRGDLAPIVISGDFGKPRPALVIQADLFNQHPTVTVLLLTSALVDAPLLRVTLNSTEENGLDTVSQVMIDKTMTVKREKLGPVFGKVEAEKLQEIERCLAVFLGVVR